MKAFAAGLRWTGWGAVGGAAASGVLWSLAGPAFGLWPLAFGALVPWMALSWRSRSGGALAAVASTLCFGLVSSLVTDHTLARALRYYFDLPWRWALVAFVAAIVAQALFYLPMGLALGALRRLGAPLFPSWLAVLLCGEWLLPRVDRAGLGSALIEAPLLPQLAELGGLGLLTALVVGVNAALATAYLASKGRRGGWLAAAAAALMLFTGAAAWLQQRVLVRVSAAPVQVLATLQPAGSLLADEDEMAKQRVWLRQRTAALAARGVPLVLWPESSLRTSVPAMMQDASEWVPPGTEVWFGTSATWPEGERAYRNSVFAADAGGRVHGRYDKWGLLPFGEYIPAWAGFLDGVLKGHVEPGEGPSWLNFHGRRVGISICYEDMIGPGLRERAARDAPELLLNFTNDRWFDSARAQLRHLRLSRLRAVELGRFLVRATTTGLSAVVDPTGRVTAQAPAGEPAQLMAQVRWLTHRTLYASFGEWAYASWGLWLALALARVVGATRAARARSRGGDSGSGGGA